MVASINDSLDGRVGRPEYNLSMVKPKCVRVSHPLRVGGMANIIYPLWLSECNDIQIDVSVRCAQV